MADLKKGFDLAAALGAVSNLDTGAADGREQIEYINIAKIDSDAANFYELSQVDDLAANIEMFGLQQPLRVRTHPDDPQRVIIVSGHRRRAAIAKLVEAGRKDLTEVPCIRDRAEGSPALQELRLIYANSDTRVLTSSEKGKQAERVEALLYQLKGEGYEFPGRMRDHVAEACKMSQSKLARLKLIRDKLAKPWVSYYEKGTLSESTAYTLAQLPDDHQNLIFEGVKKKKTEIRWLYQHDVDRYGKQLAAVDEPLTCKKDKGSMCTNREAMKAQVVHANSYENPCKSCCDKCDKLSTCHNACPVLADKIKRLRADKKAQKQQEQDAAAARAAPGIAKIKDLWSRFGQARQAAGKSVKTVYEAMDRYWDKADDQKVSALEQGDGKISMDTTLPYGYSFCLSNAQHLISAADVLGCSLDYLFGRTDELHGGTAGAAECDDDPGGMTAEALTLVRWESRGHNPPIGEPILTYDFTNAGPVYRAAEWDGSRFHSPGNPHKELSGLSMKQWLRIPDAHSGEIYQMGSMPSGGEWHLLPDAPQHDCKVVILVDIGNAAPMTMFAYYTAATKSFYHDKDKWVNVEPTPVAWFELPTLPSLHPAPAPEDPCIACKAAHPGCNECCGECVEGCNLSQDCRKYEEDSDDDQV